MTRLAFFNGDRPTFEGLLGHITTPVDVIVARHGQWCEPGFWLVNVSLSDDIAQLLGLDWFTSYTAVVDNFGDLVIVAS